MNQIELFCRVMGIEKTPGAVEQAWDLLSKAPGFVDSRLCGLVDAVQSGWFQEKSNELFRGFVIGPEDSVLDVGSGDGAATLFCANRGADVTFIDVVEEKVESLKLKVAQSPAREFAGLVSASPTLPVSDSSMTRVICMEVLEHVEEPSMLMHELMRVGKPGALYLLSVPDPVGEKMQMGLAAPAHFQSPNHIHIFEREEFVDLVSQAGLEVLKTEATGFYWTIWVLLFWLSAKNASTDLDGASHDMVQPPYLPLLNDWSKLWFQVINMPEAAPLKGALDRLLPKSQIILARKPDVE